MQRFPLVVSALIILVLLSGCEALGLGTNSLETKLTANRSTAYSLQTFSLTAEVPEKLSGKVLFKWYEGSNSTAFLEEKWNRITLTRYVSKPTSFHFRVEASYQGNTVESQVDITVSPYIGSDAANITLANHLGRNVNEVFVNLSQAMDTPLLSPLLDNNVLSNGSSVTFTNILPGWYMIGCQTSGGQTSGSYGVQVNAGDNLIELQ